MTHPVCIPICRTWVLPRVLPWFRVLTRFLLVAGLVVSLPSAALSYTADDVTQATGDITRLKKIVEDAGSDLNTRWLAMTHLPAPEQVKYFDSEVFQRHPLGRSYSLYVQALLHTLPLERYPEAIAAHMEHGFAVMGEMYLVQMSYVRKLLQSGQEAQALAESRRLIGITPIHSANLTEAVVLIAQCIRADQLKQGQSARSAVTAANDYIEAIMAGDVSQHPYAKLPFPETPAEIVKLEESGNPLTATMALLYGGRFDAARRKAQFLVAANADPLITEYGVHLTCIALNGKAGLPTAANVLLAQAQAEGKDEAEAKDEAEQ